MSTRVVALMMLAVATTWAQELPVSDEVWTRKPFTRKEFNKLMTITSDMDNEELRKRIRATSFNQWQPSIKVGKYSFYYDPKRQEKD